MRVPFHMAIRATLLAILSPARFLKFQERVAKPLGIPIASDDNSVEKVARAFWEAFLLVVGAVVAGLLIGLGLRHWLGCPIIPWVIPSLQAVSALILLLSTIYVRADAIRTHHGETLIGA